MNKNSTVVFKNIYNTLLHAVDEELNVMMKGESGVGKTALVKQVCKEKNLKMKYFSCSTIDPFADLVGIPVPKGDHVQYLREKAIGEAEIVFFDELNRSHRRVRNAVMEIIQFQSLNGDPLPNLRMAWAAVNPVTEEYHTEELDKALSDRFHLNIEVPYEMNVEYFTQKYSANIAMIAAEWWSDLTEEARSVFSPRRLDYAIEMILNPKISIEYLQPFGETIPLTPLQNQILSAHKNLSVDTILEDKEKYVKILSKTDDFDAEYYDVVSFMSNLDEDGVVKLIDIVVHMPAESLRLLYKDHNSFDQVRARLSDGGGNVEKVLKVDQEIQEKLAIV